MREAFSLVQTVRSKVRALAGRISTVGRLPLKVTSRHTLIHWWMLVAGLQRGYPLLIRRDLACLLEMQQPTMICLPERKQ
jgi:hypothetical protein